MTALTHEALHLVRAKWKLELIYRLASGTHRHGRLQATLPGVSKKVLTDALRSLERDGLVRRQVCDVPAPRTSSAR